MSKTRELRLPSAVIIGFALFAMFFGAGNLIFPVMIGADAGRNVVAVTAGFLITGVLLPILGMFVVSTETPAESLQGGITHRIGRRPGAIFTLIIFLTTGMLYAVPRVATVSYEMAAAPFLTGIEGHDQGKLLIYTLVFFAIVAFFVITPARVIDRVGGILTPLLLTFLALLVIVTLIRLPRIVSEPSAGYADSPLVTGIVEGYYTMDALASFVFGIVIVAELKKRGAKTRTAQIRGMARSGLVAGASLAAVYIGLAAVGTRQAGMGFTNGAELLAAVAGKMFGGLGQLIFAIIVLLACLTTAIGLFTSSTAYFSKLFPKLTRPILLLIQTVVAILLANMGLERILEVVSPLNQFVYPVAIVIIALGLFELVLPFRLDITYKFGAAAAAFIAFFEAGILVAPGTFNFAAKVLQHLPFVDLQMAWTVPTLIAIGVGIVMDARIRQPVRG